MNVRIFLLALSTILLSTSVYAEDTKSRSNPSAKPPRPIDLTEKAGSAAGEVGGNISGNISGYRKDLLNRIAKNWQPKHATVAPAVVLVEIGQKGNLRRAEIIETSKNAEDDKLIVSAIQSTKFAPLPGWYKGESIPFKVEMTKVLTAKK